MAHGHDMLGPEPHMVSHQRFHEVTLGATTMIPVSTLHSTDCA